jgi:hypothetical protein
MSLGKKVSKNSWHLLKYFEIKGAANKKRTDTYNTK